MQNLAEYIFDMHCQGQNRHEALKRTIHYKYPEQKMKEKIDKAIKYRSKDTSFLN